MKAKPTKNPKNVVPKQVFDRFFEALEEKGIATNVIKRLKDTIIGQNKDKSPASIIYKIYWKLMILCIKRFHPI